MFGKSCEPRIGSLVSYTFYTYTGDPSEERQEFGFITQTDVIHTSMFLATSGLNDDNVNDLLDEDELGLWYVEIW